MKTDEYKVMIKIALLIAVVSSLLLFCLPALVAQSTEVRSLAIVEPPPAAFSVSAAPSGPGGTRQYWYWVVANFPAGSSVPNGPAMVRAAQQLSGSNGVSVSWAPSTGATSYDVLRNDTNTLPLSGGTCASCAVATGVTNTFAADTGAGLSSYTIGTVITESRSLITTDNKIDPTGNPRLTWQSPKRPYEFRIDRNTWTIVGVDTLANRPSTCVGEHDVFVCKGAGCLGVTQLELFYCESDNVWISLASAGASAGYDTIEDEGIALTQRNTLNFIGDGVTCVDNAPDTDCTITGGETNWTVVGAGPIINLPATCTVDQDVFICTGSGCKGNTQIELAIYYCTATDTWTSFSQGVEFWFKYTLPETALTAAATTESIALFTTDTNTSICGTRIKHSAAFTGGGLTAMVVSVGVSGSEGLFSQPFDIFQAPGNGVFQTTNVQDMSTVGATASVLATFDSVGANVNAATAGSVSIWICSVDMPGGLP